MNVKSDILLRVNAVFILLCIMAGCIIFQVARIQIMEGNYWREKQLNTTRIDTTQGERGNIYSEDGRLLATSIPRFDLHIDLMATGLTDSLFAKELNALLAQYTVDSIRENVKKTLLEARKQKNRYLLIKEDATYTELKAYKNMPLFRNDKNKGGLIIEKKNTRELPFDLLAKRTIGYVRSNKGVGLEYKLNKYLKGDSGLVSMRTLPGGGWIPVLEESNYNLNNGKDVYTTLDINLQDITENALKRAVLEHKADHGCAIVMETKTGKIKAIANLGSNEKGEYWEDYNYAVAEKSEPGSTFKIAALTALLDNQLASDTTVVDIEGGKKTYYDKEMEDSAPYPYSEITLARAIEISSNVGISKLITKNFQEKPAEFLKILDQYHLTQPSTIDLDGEPKPEIVAPSQPEWSAVSLPWLSIGYGVSLTPLQLLTFVNAIANDGIMMRPYLVNEVKNLNVTEKIFEPYVISNSICKKETAQKVRKILTGVVERGTAKNIHNPRFKMAGKTGTAKIASKGSYKRSYKASFVGFFPAEQPLYSCIVVLTNPTESSYYGGTAAAPVFKEIAEKYCSSSPKMYTPIETADKLPIQPADKLPTASNGNQKDLQTIYNTLNLKTIANTQQQPSEWATATPNDSTQNILIQPNYVMEKLMPNIIGMGLKDAIYILENQNLKVKFTGRGQVKKQHPRYGEKVYKGQTVSIELE